MAVLKRKVFAYITRGDRLLVFRESGFPEAGIQVPAGTVEAHESLDEAVMREASEETGLTGFILVRFLGEHMRDMTEFGKDELHHRHFYHLRYDGETPSTWLHTEPDPDHGDHVVPFEFTWVRLLDEVPVLIADHGAMLPRLLASWSGVADMEASA